MHKVRCCVTNILEVEPMSLWGQKLLPMHVVHLSEQSGKFLKAFYSPG